MPSVNPLFLELSCNCLFILKEKITYENAQINLPLNATLKTQDLKVPACISQTNSCICMVDRLGEDKGYK